MCPQYATYRRLGRRLRKEALRGAKGSCGWKTLWADPFQGHIRVRYEFALGA